MPDKIVSPLNFTNRTRLKPFLVLPEGGDLNKKIKKQFDLWVKFTYNEIDLLHLTFIVKIPDKLSHDQGR